MPLKNVHIDAKVVDFISEINVMQTYVNLESHPIEAIYVFPVEEEAAVISFEAEVDNRKISTQIKEKQQARNDYDDAVQSKKTAVLLEEIQPDIFQINVGYLNPNEEANISISYVSELPVEDCKIKLTIPTTIAPRYVSSSDDSDASKQIAAIPYSTNTPAPLSFNFMGLAQSRVKSIKSPSHDFMINISDNENEKGQFSYSGELSINTTDMDRDIIIYIESHNPEGQNKAIAFLEKPNEQAPDQGYVGMISLVPSFELDEQLVELIFLVDCSYSMEGSSINQAKKALELFLYSLPSDCYFNIWSFGSTYDALFPEGSTKYSDSSLNKALDHVRQMSADYGGTEIYNPIRDIFVQDKPQNGYLRQVFVLTDGDVSNASSVISLVRQNSAKGRTFSLGIGSCASRHLVKGIARAGCGTSVFATENEDLRAKVMSQLKNALQPAISSIEIKWGDTSFNEHSITKEPKKTNHNLSSQRYYSEYMKNLYQQHNDEDSTKEKSDIERLNVSSNIPPIFDGERLLAYHLYPSGASMPSMISMKADTPSGPLNIDIHISENNIIDENGLVRKLAARKKIQELEDSKNVDGYEGYGRKEDVKKTIIQLGLENSLASNYTSFVGIDSKTGDVLCDMPMSRREIRNQIASGFGGFRTVSGRGWWDRSNLLDNAEYGAEEDYDSLFVEDYECGMYTRVESKLRITPVSIT